MVPIVDLHASLGDRERATDSQLGRCDRASAQCERIVGVGTCRHVMSDEDERRFDEDAERVAFIARAMGDEPADDCDESLLDAVRWVPGKGLVR